MARHVKPVLTLLSSLALIPTGWRTGLVVPRDVTAFKAGKDL